MLTFYAMLIFIIVKPIISAIAGRVYRVHAWFNQALFHIYIFKTKFRITLAIIYIVSLLTDATAFFKAHGIRFTTMARFITRS